MERIAGLLQEIPREPRQILAALHLVQHELGWVPREGMGLIARHLRVSEAQVYGPASFYSEFRLTPPPRTLVTWCSGPRLPHPGWRSDADDLGSGAGLQDGGERPQRRLWSLAGTMQRHL